MAAVVPAQLVDLALGYALRGWPVFPLQPGGKQPLGALVPNGLKNASLDEKRIRSWWNAQPDANVAIRTGVAFDVADFDSEAAMRKFQAVCAEYGVDPKIFPRARTGSGGRHVLVAPTGFGNRTRVMPDLDWRGKDGYIVAPGSIHPSGGLYEWIKEPKGELPACPEWLLALLRPQQLWNPQPEAPADAPEAYVKAAMGRELEGLRSTREGERNHALNTAAFALGQMVGAGWLQRHVADAELKAAAYAIGLEEPEVSRTIRSGLDSGVAEPRQQPPGGFGAAAAGEIRGSRPAAASHVPSGEEGDAEVVSIAGFDALVEPGPIWAQKAGVQIPVIARGVLAAGGMAMMISDPKSGKTWLVLEIAICVATGRPILDHYPVEQSGRVLYIATEGSREGTLGRLKALSLGHGLDPDQVLNGIDFIWRKGVRFDDKAFTAWLVAHATDYTLIIVDVLVEAWNGDENKAPEVSALMRAIRPVTDAGATVLLLHHLSKGQEGENRSIWQRIRGSTAFFGAFDSGIGLERPLGASRTKVSFQHRDDSPAEPFTFAWPTDEHVTGDKPISLDWEVVNNDLEAINGLQPKILRIVREHPGMSAASLKKAVGGRAELVSKAINSLVEVGQIYSRDESVRKGNLVVTKHSYHLSDPAVPSDSRESGTAGPGDSPEAGIAGNSWESPGIAEPAPHSPNPPGGGSTTPLSGVVDTPGVGVLGSSGSAEDDELVPMLRTPRTKCPACHRTAYLEGPEGAPQRKCNWCGECWYP